MAGPVEPLCGTCIHRQQIGKAKVLCRKKGKRSCELTFGGFELEDFRCC